MDGVRHLSMGSWEKMVEKVNFMRCVQKYDKFRAHRRDKLWIMWITWCISAFFSKIREKKGDNFQQKFCG